ncbi:serine hydrolase domain-containing protein [Mesobacillus selenatarsenatis]|uniref:Serine hydrolase n=1 Tax=Mesobacillus selenatarsenatis TaxID=388741 RepID=A0A846TJL4_9BACI|nr:serine hydrolase [Mesobacillus selenatarsenatis]NKE06969.1 serine hydrolase [Mesobacillus selenatarsenatis]
MKKLLLSVVLGIVVMGSGCSNQEGTVTEGKKEVILQETEAYWPTKQWRTSLPEAQGMDSSKLVELYEQLEGNDKVHSFIVVRNGYIVGEKYGGTYSEKSSHNVYSVTKSILGAVAGIAAEEKVIKLEDRALNFFHDVPIENMSQAKKDLTIQHLLTMTTGFDWPEWTENKGVWTNWDNSEDQVKYYLDQQINEEKVGKFNYSSGDPHTLSAILQQRLGKTTSEYAFEKLFEPIGMNSVRWSPDKKGISMGGAGIFMTPRDMAKFGLLYLNKGQWDGNQIVPMDWVEESISPQAATEIPGGENYGYYFWLTEMDGHKVYEAMGAHGQFIGVIPDLNIVAVQTASGNDFDALLKEYVIPAAVSEEPIKVNEEANKRLKELME